MRAARLAPRLLRLDIERLLIMARTVNRELSFGRVADPLVFQFGTKMVRRRITPEVDVPLAPESMTAHVAKGMSEEEVW